MSASCSSACPSASGSGECQPRHPGGVPRTGHRRSKGSDMQVTQPPRLATWLLERLASGEKRESVIGDLAEQYQHGRSLTWYWRQVLSTILVGVMKDLREHRLLAIRSVILTSAVVVGWVECTWVAYLCARRASTSSRCGCQGVRC